MTTRILKWLQNIWQKENKLVKLIRTEPIQKVYELFFRRQ